MKFEKEITTILQSNNYLIYIYTEEEERLENSIVQVTKKVFQQKIEVWDFIEGYRNNTLSDCKQNPIEALNIITKTSNINTKVFLLKDFNVFINDIAINRKLKNLHYYLKKDHQYVILSGTENNIPKNMQQDITCIHLPLPNRKEIEAELTRFFYKTDFIMSNQRDNISIAYTGFSIKKIRHSISKLIINKTSTKNIIKEILNEKEKIINNKEGLKFYANNNKQTDLGGLTNLKDWLKIRTSTFTTKAYTYGIKMPKGILLVGIQGTGKSLSAAKIANEWSMPLLRLDVSKIFTGILGESENQIDRIIMTCNKMAPCILWIDEIDKIFSENTTINDSGTTQRVTNIFLTWLAEREDKVFIVATANHIDKLPIEMLRKGRFDEIFFVDLPGFKERIKIFQIHLKKVRPITWNKYNIYYLSKLSNGFSGAEIKQCISEAMYKAFYEKREFTTRDIQKSIIRTIPLIKSEKQKIVKLRQWGHNGTIKIA
uniref:Uncharacterized AAA domain-containing protein ycf46 n=1 Tax=Polysiphonia urceolata TaxID=173545 RepID=A0A1Z1MBS1_POLUR|nr:hypothetical protein [Polysiphonia stricta]ARW63426.1 hypothetical protein [Polysiphonia stricta]